MAKSQPQELHAATVTAVRSLNTAQLSRCPQTALLAQSQWCIDQLPYLLPLDDRLLDHRQAQSREKFRSSLCLTLRELTQFRELSFDCLGSCDCSIGIEAKTIEVSEE